MYRTRFYDLTRAEVSSTTRCDILSGESLYCDSIGDTM